MIAKVRPPVYVVIGAFDPKKINRDLGLPYHEGSIKFFKEAGLM